MKEDSKTKITLQEAVKIVNAEIDRLTKEHEKIAATEEQEPIMLLGETITEHDCQLMVDPKEIAKIYLDFDYATCLVLGSEPSPDMWEAIAKKYGLGTVASVYL